MSLKSKNPSHLGCHFSRVPCVESLNLQEKDNVVAVCVLQHAHTRAHANSPCRYLAVVHVRCNDHACFPFVALLEGGRETKQEVMMCRFHTQQPQQETTDFHSLQDCKTHLPPPTPCPRPTFSFPCRDQFLRGGTVGTESQSTAGIEKDSHSHSQFEIKLKSSLLCFFSPHTRRFCTS